MAIGFSQGVRARRGQARRGRSSLRTGSPLYWSAVVFLATWIVFGGAMPVGVPLFAVLALASTVLVGALALYGDAGAWRGLPRAAQMLLAFLALMPLMQLVPLPPALWHALPGRALAVETLDAAGIAQSWRPLTLAVDATFRSWLMMMWLLAFLLVLLQLSSRDLRRMFGLVAVLGLLNVAIGVIQVISGYSAFQFYDQQPFLVGLFANKNHTGLFIAFTFLAGYAALYGEAGWHRKWLGVVSPLVFVLLIALLATFSRAGLVLGVAALGFVALLSLPPRLGRRMLVIVAVGTGALLLVVLAVSSSDLAIRSSARFGGVEGDLRWLIWEWSWPLVGAYFPAGGGIGSFTELFPPTEQLAWVKPTNVNHVHNDYIEQLIEVGIAAPLCWALIVVALVQPLRLAWITRGQSAGRVALIASAMLALTALHSIVDYPLRRPAIAAAVILALAALLRPNGRKSDCANPPIMRGATEMP